MQIRQLTARDFRIHRETTITLDPRLTLVVGPNEAGKSTLMQAGHCALFIRATYNGSLREGMLPRSGGGPPRVEMVFEAEGSVWILTKTFSGASGQVSLTPEGGTALAGEAADLKLAELLGGEEALSGRGVSNQLPARWQHIWVPQGMAGTSPTVALAGHFSQLAELLSGRDNTSLLMSALDKKLLTRIEREWRNVHTTRGDYAARSQVQERIKAHQEATVALEEARERVQRLADHTRVIEEATDFLASADDTKAQIESKLKETETRENELKGLQEKLNVERQRREAAVERLQVLAEREDQIRNQRARRDQLVEEIEPLRVRSATAAHDLDSARGDVERLRKSLDERRTQFRKASTDVALARAMVELIEATSRADAFESEMEQTEKLREELQTHRRALADLPEVDEDTLQKLDLLDRQAREAQTILDATAASIRIDRTTTEVRLNGQVFAEGETQRLTEDGELEVGDVAVIRISPGGGGSLTNAKQALADGLSALADAVADVGAESLEHARSAYSEALKHRIRVETLEAELMRRGEETLDDRMKAIEDAVAQAKRDLRARGGDPDASLPPADEARTRFAHSEERQKEAETAGDNEQSTLSEAEQRFASLERAQLEQADKQRTLETDLQVIETRLSIAVDEAKSDEARQQEIEAATATAEKARESENESARALAGLDGQQIEQDQARLVRSLNDLVENIKERGNARAEAWGALKATGDQDPHASLDRAQAAYEDAARRREAAERDAKALDLLRREFARASGELGEKLSGPLRERVDPYLEMIFGRGARSAVGIDGVELQEVGLARGHQFTFAELSAGAQEQFGAAFRLATAEVLSESFGGTLPVFLDDTFANSDDQRIQGISRALFHAAEKGLQVVLFTCRPEAWRELGAKTVLIGGGDSGPVTGG